MIRRLGVFTLVLSLSALSVYADQAPQSRSQLTLAQRYLEARQASMQVSADASHINSLLALCDPALVYEHPRVGIKMTGVEAAREGMTGFLGSSRNARIKIAASLPGRDMIAVQTEVSFEGKDGEGWKSVKRQQVWVFEFKDQKISRIIEYW